MDAAGIPDLVHGMDDGGEIFEAIVNGNISYELCRPIDIYDMWFARSMANRFSKALLRCVPVLLISVLVREPYGMAAPVSAQAFFYFG